MRISSFNTGLRCQVNQDFESFSGIVSSGNDLILSFGRLCGRDGRQSTGYLRDVANTAP